MVSTAGSFLPLKKFASLAASGLVCEPVGKVQINFTKTHFTGYNEHNNETQIT